MRVFSYKNEKDGALVHEIAPIANLERSISSNGRDKFMFHADGVYLNREVRPSILSLLCLVNEGDVANDIASLQDCLKDLSRNDIDTLSERLFIHRAPETFHAENCTSQSSILDRVNGFYELKGATHSTTALSPQADRALKKLLAALEKNKITNRWKSGDLVVFNNLRTMHGRGDVRGGRWLQRCYGSFYHNTAEVVEL